MQTRQLRRCALTSEDLFSQLRQQSIFDLSELKYLLYESSGGLTAVRIDGDEPPPLVVDALQIAERRAGS